MAAIAGVGEIAGGANRYAINFLYNQWRPSWRRQTCPRTSRPVIVRLGMMTVRTCQAVAVAGRSLNPRVRRMVVTRGISTHRRRRKWQITASMTMFSIPPPQDP